MGLFPLQRGDETRHIVLGDNPDQSGVDSVIPVCQQDTKPADVAPIHPRVPQFGVLRQLIRCFADDFKQPLDAALMDGRGQETLATKGDD